MNIDFMNISIISIININLIRAVNKGFVGSFGNVFPFIKGAFRIAEVENYTENFGKQCNKFDKTLLDNKI